MGPFASTARDGDGTDVLARALARFGHSSLRPGQADVIADIFAGRPVIGVMPTGAGKSLCFQLPATVLGERGGVTLVVSPLIALMKDQVDALRARGIAAVALTSQASAEEQRDILDGIRAGLFTLVYVAPERFRSPRFAEALRAVAGAIALVAIDEAHCISEWGHDFRPDYRRLGPLIAELAPPRLAAFTATATPEVRGDIAAQLGMTDPRVHVHGFDRPNLTYAVQQVGGAADKIEQLVELVRLRDGGVALVYAATRKNAETYAQALKRAGMRARVYHAGLENEIREKAQDVFMAGKLDVIVATNAFGMGVDKSDIRLVVHADIPRSPEAYYQEAGRGGRDGKPTRCVLLFNHSDIRLQEFLIDASYPSPELLRGLWKLLATRPELGALDGRGGDDEPDGRDLRPTVSAAEWRSGSIEQRLKPHLPEASNATIGSALRILERHGMLARDAERLAASRPPPGAYPPLDVDSFVRRADIERKKLRTMVDYAYTPRCRRQLILEYFGDDEWADRSRRCGACDTCEAIAAGRPPDALSDGDASAIRGVLALIGALHGRFGRTRIAAIANGSDDDARFLDLPERGCLRGWTQKQVLDLVRALEGAGLVEASRGEYPTLRTTRRGDQAAIGRIDVGELGVRMPAIPRRKRRR